MKINAKKFRVDPGGTFRLKERATKVKSFFDSKKTYKKLMEEHDEQLSEIPCFHEAANRHALLLIFQTMDAAGNWNPIAK